MSPPGEATGEHTPRILSNVFPGFASTNIRYSASADTEKLGNTSLSRSFLN